jgi:hypothetical protein
VETLDRSVTRNASTPAFVVLGKVLTEELRRRLRIISRDHPLFIVEANDAPNHLSLAREAKMMDRTLRFLTPAIFSPHLAPFATVFIAGYEEFVRMIETVHFQLKGTPSAADVELLTFLVKHGSRNEELRQPSGEPLYPENSPFFPELHRTASAAIARTEARNACLAGAQVARLEDRLSHVVERVAGRLADLRVTGGYAALAADPFEGLAFERILDALPEGRTELLEAFKVCFLRHHPEYRPDAAMVVSGSARTALGLLGFHCGIREVVIPDLSWTYEHCFPSVTSVPLTPDFELEVDRLIATVEDKLGRDPDWGGHGAVVFNNPHNATGQVFREEALRTLLRHFLGRGVCVIDDLSYQNVAPSRDLSGPMTLRQLANELARLGYISTEQADRLITVHSLSKTDCLAGARLSVVEIRDPDLRACFEAVNRSIVPNTGAILLAYLFYRQGSQSAGSYWRLRNLIFEERMSAIEKAVADLRRTAIRSASPSRAPPAACTRE